MGDPNSPFITKIYDVSDLRSIVPTYTNVPDLDMNSALNRQGLVFRQPPDQNRPETKVSMQEIANLIQDVVEPDYWFEHPDAIIIWGNHLIIRATPEIHKKIQ